MVVAGVETPTWLMATTENVKVPAVNTNHHTHARIRCSCIPTPENATEFVLVEAKRPDGVLEMLYCTPREEAAIKPTTTPARAASAAGAYTFTTGSEGGMASCSPFIPCPNWYEYVWYTSVHTLLSQYSFPHSISSYSLKCQTDHQ